MDRSEVRSQVESITGRTDKSSLVNTGINLALIEIGKRREFRDMQSEFSVSVNTGDTQVTLDTDQQRLIEIRVIDGQNPRPIIIKPKTWLVEKFADPSSYTSGKPWVGYLENKILHFYPKSNSNYTLTGTKVSFSELTSDSDEIPIRGLDFPVICWTASYLLSSIEEHQNASVWYQRFERTLLDTIRSDKRSPIVYKHERNERTHEPPPEYWKDPFVRGV